MSRTPAHTISTEWVKIDGADRLRVGIDLEHDFATIYLHPETVESLRVALGAIPARPAAAPILYNVEFLETFGQREGVRDVEATSPELACIYAICHRFDVEDVRLDAGDTYSGRARGTEIRGKIRAVATATSSATESK